MTETPQTRVTDVMLERYLAGDLSPAQRQRVDAALTDQPGVRARLEALRSERDAFLRAAPAEAMAHKLATRLAVEAEARTAKRSWRSWMLAPSLGIATVLVLGVIYQQRFGGEVMVMEERARFDDEAPAPAAAPVQAPADESAGAGPESAPAVAPAPQPRDAEADKNEWASPPADAKPAAEPELRQEKRRTRSAPAEKSADGRAAGKGAADDQLGGLGTRGTGAGGGGSGYGSGSGAGLGEARNKDLAHKPEATAKKEKAPEWAEEREAPAKAAPSPAPKATADSDDALAAPAADAGPRREPSTKADAPKTAAPAGAAQEGKYARPPSPPVASETAPAPASERAGAAAGPSAIDAPTARSAAVPAQVSLTVGQGSAARALRPTGEVIPAGTRLVLTVRAAEARHVVVAAVRQGRLSVYARRQLQPGATTLGVTLAPASARTAEALFVLLSPEPIDAASIQPAPSGKDALGLPLRLTGPTAQRRWAFTVTP